MLAPIKNYDLICYSLRNNLYSDLDNPLKKDVDRLSKEIVSVLVSGKKIQNQSTQILSQLFNLRIKAIKWFAKEKSFDYLKSLSEVSTQIQELREYKKLDVLTENILFALRCNQRVFENLFSLSGNQLSGSFNLSQLPEITYQQFLASLAIAIPDDEKCQKMADLTNASLHIEFVMLSVDIIRDENLKISDKAINELSFLVADAAQEYSALIMDLELLKPLYNRQTFNQLNFDMSFVKEQKKLADTGLNHFTSDFAH